MTEPGKPRGTTVVATLAPGAPGPGGYRRLAPGLGEAMTVRSDLGGGPPSADLVSLVAFVQLSDLHVTDGQSPARLPSLDRVGADGPPTVRAGTYRPQEVLSTQVVEAAARAVRALGGGPATGAPLRLALSTGDNIDNGQRNELTAYLALLDGGRTVRPDSGDPACYEGMGAEDAYDAGYWHPEGTPPGEPDDRPRRLLGFPTVPGLHEASRRPFPATGLGLPWYAVYGNHDALLAGTAPAVAALAARAVGAEQLTGFDAATDVTRLVAGAEADPGLAAWLSATGPTRRVTADAERRPVDARQWVAAHRERPGEPFGHGLGADAAAEGRAHYAVDAGLVRFLVLDTVNRAGGWQGSLDAAQLAWLEAEMVAGHRRYRDAGGRERTTRASDRLFVLASHHPLECLVNDYAPDGGRRVLQTEVRALLRRFPNVVLWVNGHTHAHLVTPVTGSGPGAAGFWQVTTASLIDWPQQVRVLEIAVDAGSGDLVIAALVVDHAGAADPRAASLGEVATLAGWSRELAVNAWPRRGREPFGRGGAGDRNVLLTLPAPFPMPRGPVP